MKHQRSGALSRVKTTRTDQTLFVDEVHVLSITAPIPLEKGEARAMCLLYYVVLNDKESIWLNRVQFIATLANTEYDKGRITAYESIQELAKNSYCLQASSTVGLLDSTLNYDRNQFLVRNERMNGAVEKGFPVSLLLSLSYQLHFRTLGGHPGERHIYGPMQHE